MGLNIKCALERLLSSTESQPFALNVFFNIFHITQKVIYSLLEKVPANGECSKKM